MKTVLIVILAGLLAVPIVSWAIYGNMGEILPWFGLNMQIKHFREAKNDNSPF